MHEEHNSYMRLRDYLTANGLTEAAFARLASLEVSTVHRAAGGKVMPSPVTMRAIIAATGGAVQPNDFFGAGTAGRVAGFDSVEPSPPTGANIQEASNGHLRVGIDIGGTFTDLMLAGGPDGVVTVAKVPTTPGDLWQGVLGGLDSLGIAYPAIDMVVHGTTIGLNAFLERRGQPAGLITTRGFRDVYEIGRHNRIETYDLAYQKPQPLVPRRHRREVRERIGPDGAIVEPLAEADVLACIDHFRAAGIRSVAICLLHAYANPAHEDRVAAILAEEFPEASVTLSSALARQWREYERTSTAVINAYIMPAVGSYLAGIERSLAERGYRRPFFISQSSGGIMSVDAARNKPVQTIMSGPAGGAMAAAFIGERAGHRNVITFDMGGTSTDVSLVHDGRLRVTDESSLDRHPLMVSMIDIKSIGAGGGSIARVDAAGALEVGPQSAGALPGPVCYGRGGADPTVTDANLILGRLPASHFLDGAMRLDVALACRQLEGRIAAPLGLGLVEAASGILEVINAKMGYAVRAITVERGLDPKSFALLAFGGAGPMHACAIASHLGIPEIVVPVAPGAFSAFGMLVSDVRHDFVRTQLTTGDDGRGLLAADAVLREMIADATDRLRREGVSTPAMQFERAVDLRYVGQEYTVAVPLHHNVLDDAALADLRRRFHWLHERNFGHASPSEPTEIVNLRIAAIGRIARPRLSSLSEGRAEPPDAARLGDTEAYFASEGGSLRAALYRRERLLAGNRLSGPAIVVERTATTVLEPGFWLEVMPEGHLTMRKSQ